MSVGFDPVRLGPDCQTLHSDLNNLQIAHLLARFLADKRLD